MEKVSREINSLLRIGKDEFGKEKMKENRNFLAKFVRYYLPSNFTAVIFWRIKKYEIIC